MVSLNDEFREFSSVSRWLGRLSSEGCLPNLRALRLWCTWLRGRGLEWRPDELVRMQFEAVGQDRFRVLDLLQEWVGGLDLRVSTKTVYYQYVRSFFLHNRAELPRDRSFRVSSRFGKHTGGLRVDDVRALLGRCNACYRAAFLGMVSGGMGQGEVVWWSDNGLRDTLAQLDGGVVPLRVDLPGRKRGRGVRPFYTFVGVDAVRALRQWFEVRGRGGGSIFLNQFGGAIDRDALHAYWRRQLLELGLLRPGERYGKNPHEARDLFRSRWQMSGADAMAAEFFMGHVVDPNEYNKAFGNVDYARSEYVRASAWLNVLSEDPERVPRRDVDRLVEVQNLRYEELRREMDAVRDRVDKISK